MGANALNGWVFLGHIGISRLRIPMIDDALIVFMAPVPLLIGNAFVGREQVWPWLYYASFYLAMSLATTLLQVHVASKEHELASFKRIASPLGPLLVLYVGIPFYAAAGWADSHGMLSPMMEMLLAVGAMPAALFFLWLFFRSWRRAIAESNVKE